MTNSAGCCRFEKRLDGKDMSKDSEREIERELSSGKKKALPSINGTWSVLKAADVWGW